MTENPQDQPEQSPYGAKPPSPGPLPGQPPAYGAQGQQAVSPSDARMWSLFAHVGGIFFSFVPALVIYLVYKDRDPFIRGHSAQALNFQIILAIVYFVGSLLTLVLIGLPILLAAVIASLVFSIMAAIAANSGQEYTYPMTPKMIT